MTKPKYKPRRKLEEVESGEKSQHFEAMRARKMKIEKCSFDRRYSYSHKYNYQLLFCRISCYIYVQLDIQSPKCQRQTQKVLL